MNEFTRLGLGERILLNGTIFTARDKAHIALLQEDFKPLHNGIVYHCGPLVDGNSVLAAGPTTSARMDSYTPALIERYGIRAIIGKGGMGPAVLEALRGKAVYFTAIGGAGVFYANHVRLRAVHKPELGMTDAIYELEVKDFPVIVTMDSRGNSLHEAVREKSEKKLGVLLGR